MCTKKGCLYRLSEGPSPPGRSSISSRSDRARILDLSQPNPRSRTVDLDSHNTGTFWDATFGNMPLLKLPISSVCSIGSSVAEGLDRDPASRGLHRGKPTISPQHENASFFIPPDDSYARAPGAKTDRELGEHRVLSCRPSVGRPLLPERDTPPQKQPSYLCPGSIAMPNPPCGVVSRKKKITVVRNRCCVTSASPPATIFPYRRELMTSLSTCI